jgi:hypothetical protein
MSDQNKGLSDIEKEALVSWREWPIYVVLRLKNLQEIQQKLRIQGETPSQLVRRDEMLKAVHDQNDSPSSASSSKQASTAADDSEDDDYYEVLSYED